MMTAVRRAAGRLVIAWGLVTVGWGYVVARSQADDKVLVLRNGNVLLGDISRVRGRFVVRSEGSELRVAEADVAFAAADLHAAYLRTAGRITPGQGDAHLRLARWCIRHHLPDEAAEQLKLARRADPDNVGLDELDRQLTSSRRAVEQVRLPVERPRPAAPAAIRPVRSRLSKRTMSDFTASVQPLFLNRCGNATCHGAATKTAYQLLRAPRTTPMTRSLTERNLSATLGMIDVHEPANSLLVLSAMAPHGGGASQLDEAQLALLVTWVNRATAEITGHVADSPEPPTPAADSTPGLPEQVQAEPSSSQAESHAPSPADPFDPEIFNRRHTERPRPVE